MDSHGEKGAFATYAERCWQAGLSIIPTEPGTKHPAKGNSGWLGFLNNGPSAIKQIELKQRFSNHGLGLLLGSIIREKIRVGALDTDDGRYARLVRAILGGPFVGKRGKRGETLFFCYQEDDGLKSSKIADSNKNGIIDLLLAGKMTILPPTPHPETGKPYEEIGPPIYDALEQLRRVDRRIIDLLRLAVGSEHSATLLTGSGTHEAGLRLTAQLVSFGCSDEEVTAIVVALLPEDYAGNSIDELPGWIADARKKGFDQPKAVRSRKPTDAEMLVAALEEKGVTLSHDAMQRPYLSVPQGSDGKLTYLVGSSASDEVLRRVFFQKAKLALRENTVRDTSALLTARAKFEGPEITVHTRIARHENAILIDLGRPDGQIVRITAAGVELTHQSPVLFLRATGSLPLPTPDLSGGLEDLKKLRVALGLDKKTFFLILAFLLNCLRPGGPFMCMLVEGQQGSGKSFICTIVRRLIDPNVAEKVRLPEDEQELMVLANNLFLMVFDNSSGMKGTISDLLCALSTGSGYAKRKLYSDNDVNVMQAVRPFIINGISDVAPRPDLNERAIPVELERMPDEDRRTEAELGAEFDALQSRVLGAIYNIVAGALAREDEVPVPRGIRMADTARWLAAAERAAGVPDGFSAKVLRAAQSAKMTERVNNEAIVITLRKVLEKGPFEGTVGELLTSLKDHVDYRIRYFPETATKLAKDLERLKTGMAIAGVHFEKGERVKDGRLIRVWEEGQDDSPSQEVVPRVEY